ncbi:MAG: translation initiation factor [DPANN group archaeon]|nr:translation initiation factor [DPANN group archaeon]
MQDICNKCGLPSDLCVCEVITKESQKIKIYLEKKRFRKHMTIIQGIDEKDINLKELTKKLKSKLACGGTSKKGIIGLQGEHIEEVKKVLIELGFREESIIS